MTKRRPVTKIITTVVKAYGKQPSCCCDSYSISNRVKSAGASVFRHNCRKRQYESGCDQTHDQHAEKAGILTSRPGVAGASLKRDPADISLLDIYRAVQSQEELFAIHEKPNPDCPVGKRIQSTLDETFHSVQKAMENELASKSLKDILSHLF